MACGVCTSGSTARRSAATRPRPASGCSATTSTTTSNDGPVSRPNGSTPGSVIRAWRARYSQTLGRTSEIPDLRSVGWLVLERELELRPVGNIPAVFQVNVLCDDLSHPKIAERLGRSSDRLRSRVFPRLATCPDDLGHPVYAHAAPP